ncbi:NAD(P)/FAD-dependent oxidoreductase [Salinibacterium sp. SWN139]|uniref:FAD-dependent oxidoreductase n=1 Tax=Salinibacterium sp. SWN139 TaxID=2792055 RepID=UPI0018CC83E6|nr:FAD-dependent oxidoreductase [Salinibacterium sp. SWN139]MBH0054378.1 NAD(P)/FAD-dependent oxidoreductase [Salinibacterium sp. SWN139]
MTEKHWDVVVIGAGPAGLNAALLLGRARRRTLVIHSGSPRNRFADHMHGVLGNEGVTPLELRETGAKELALYGVEMQEGSVERLDEIEEGVRLTLSDDSTVDARAVIVATGITDELPPIEGLAEHWGSSVLHCPYCHGWEVRDTKLGVLATSLVGLHQAFLVRQWSDDVTAFTALLDEVTPEEASRLRARGVKLVDSPVIAGTARAGKLTGLRTADGETVPIDAVFTVGTPRPHDAFLAHLELARTEIMGSSFIAVDQGGKTSHDRIWAVGNVVNPMLTVPMSTGAGAMTGGAVNAALVAEDFDIAERPASPAEFWESRYSGDAHQWSGRVNAVLEAVVPELETGFAEGAERTALDLGCGEGGDALWLAQRGWRATGVDISRNAIERGRQAAEGAGIANDQLRFVAADLSEFESSESFDLVTASFLQSPVELPRADILKRAAMMVAPGGHLLITAHGTPPRPPAAPSGAGHSSPFPSLYTPDGDLAALELELDDWTVLVHELRPRTIELPGKGEFITEDSIVLVQRNAQAAE